MNQGEAKKISHREFSGSLERVAANQCEQISAVLIIPHGFTKNYLTARRSRSS
jgi:hypothetical protein